MDIVLAAISNGDAAALLGPIAQALQSVVGRDRQDAVTGWGNADLALAYAVRDPRTSDVAVAVADDGSFTYVDGPVAALGSSRPGTAGGGHTGERRGLQAVQAAAQAWRAGCPSFAALSGSFRGIHYDSRQRRTLIFTDRLGSRPIFCRPIANAIYFASDIRALLQLPGGLCELDLEALAQFVRYQMILGERTLYKQISVLAPATVAEAVHHLGELNRRRYWTLAPLPFFDSMEEAVAATIHTLTAATERVTAASQRLAILLSGGFDSRMLVASLDAPARAKAAAFTFGPGLTDEAQVAYQVAAHCATPWNFIEEPLKAYWEYMADGLLASNGLHSAAHLHFSYPVALIAGAGYDTVLNGWGFDLPFSGSYFPKETINVLGRELFTNRLVELATTQATTNYLHTALDVQANCFANSLLGQKLRPYWEEAPAAGLGQLVVAASTVSEHAYDWIDYTLIGFGVAKFRSYSLVTSARARLRERNPLFESDVLEVYQRLPARWRFLGPVFRRALRQLRPDLGAIAYSNIGTSGFAHPYLQAAATQVRAAWRANIERAQMLRARITHAPVPSSGRYKYGAYHHATSMVDYLWVETAATRHVRRLLSNGPLVDAGILDPQQLPGALRRCAAGSSKSAYTLLCWIALAIWLDAHPAAIPAAAG